LEALLVEGLQEVVDCMDFERLKRVLVVGGHEHDHRREVRAQGFDDLETVTFGNLNVEEDEVGRQLPYGLDRLVAVAAFPHDLDVGLGLEQGPYPVARQGLVVHDDGSDLRHGSRFRSCLRGEARLVQDTLRTSRTRGSHQEPTPRGAVRSAAALETAKRGPSVQLFQRGTAAATGRAVDSPRASSQGGTAGITAPRDLKGIDRATSTPPLSGVRSSNRWVVP